MEQALSLNNIILYSRYFSDILFDWLHFYSPINYPMVAKGTISWALAGRNSKKLDKVKSELLKQIQEANPGINMDDIKIDTIIVDTSTPSTIHNLVKDTKTVITTAGPYNKYGSRVVEFCANYGTSYVDITGETDWVKEMIMKYDDVAQRTGAKIVSFCGHDSIPWDITVNELSKLMKEECKVRIFVLLFVHDKQYYDLCNLYHLTQPYSF